MTMNDKSKYEWGKIKADYELGKSNAYLHKKYSVPYSTLSMKIKRDGWEVVNSEVSAMSMFKKGCEAVSGAICEADSQEKKQQIVEQINTIIEDNDLIQNNRKLLKGFQDLMTKGIEGGIYRTPQDIKAGASTVRDIEAVANPKDAATKVNIQQNTAVQKITRTIIDPKNELGDAVTEAIKRKFRLQENSRNSE